MASAKQADDAFPRANSISSGSYGALEGALEVPRQGRLGMLACDLSSRPPHVRTLSDPQHRHHADVYCPTLMRTARRSLLEAMGSPQAQAQLSSALGTDVTPSFFFSHALQQAGQPRRC